MGDHFPQEQAMWNIIIGLIFVAGGLSGKIALRGTQSSGAIAVVGGLMVAYGIFQVVQQRKG